MKHQCFREFNVHVRRDTEDRRGPKYTFHSPITLCAYVVQYILLADTKCADVGFVVFVKLAAALTDVQLASIAQASSLEEY